MAGGGGGATLEETATFAAAVVCLVLVFFPILVEYSIHYIGHWLRSKNKIKLHEALEKIKSEFMLLGFMSLILTITPESITKICINAEAVKLWCPCKPGADHHQRHLLSARNLAGNSVEDKQTCKEGKLQFISLGALHELHIFIFLLACVHVLNCVLTMALGKAKMNRWQVWEDETRTVEHSSSHDPERFRYMRETSFGRRHMGHWITNPVLLRILCFFRQFYSSVPKVDYLTLRHGFIVEHLAPQHQRNFNFQNYIDKSLEEDFKAVVGVSPTIWFAAVLSLLFNKYGLHHSLWTPAIPLLVLLLVGTKLQLIIAKMALRIHETTEVVVGTPVVQLGDDLFWFSSPRFLLFLINFILFQNAFQISFFVYTSMKYGLNSCFHKKTGDSVIILSMGLLVLILCSYVTLPLYALVTQMGSNIKSTIFSKNVADAVKKWYLNAKKQRRASRFHHLSSQNEEENQTMSIYDSDDEAKHLEEADQITHLMETSSNRGLALQDVGNGNNCEIGLVEMTLERASEGTRSKDFSYVRRSQSSVEFRR